uniref:Leukotriene A-4 hydrolase n=1 Tax=Lygus hesperus TaxID=30085 RepID=A0A0A9XJW6_LYGHE
MSGIEEKDRYRKDGDTATYVYNQPIPISSYLIAMCVGVVEEHRISPRCSIWSEVEDLERCAKEFEDIEKMVQVAETINGPYVWGRYDLLVLPPSFPYGGMENPNLTFVTPSLVVGDKSLVNVVLHE